MSSNIIKLPESTDSKVHQETQYGMVYPDGSVDWNVVEIRNRSRAVRDLTLPEYQRTLAADWRDELSRRAKAASVNPYDYSNQHKIITRTVMMAVTEAQDAGVVRPWPEPDPGQRPAPVAPPFE